MARPVAVGIDSIGVYVPRLYVDLTGEWARARAPLFSEGDVQRLVSKVTDGVGVRRMAIADAHQDCATLAAMAAKRAIDAAGIDPRDIDYLAVGTETTVDQSKSTAAYVLGMLERHYGVSLAEVGAPQVQFACIGATYALEAAVSRIRAGDNSKRYALVVASDISRYELGTAGEYTQGAGAVALVVCEKPRVLEFEPGLTGTVTRDERDFFRPNWSQTAVVDGKYSIDIYLDCMASAYAAYQRACRRAAKETGPDAVDHFLFHVPFPRMAEYAAARVFTDLWCGHPRMRAALLAEVPALGADPGADPRAWRKEIERAVARSALFRREFARRVEPSLTLSRDVGNVYSAALFLALASLFEGEPAGALRGRRIVLGAYGSGASARVVSGVVAPDYDTVTGALRVGDDLRPETEGGTRVALTMAQYERLHALRDFELDVDDDVARKVREGGALAAGDVATLRRALEHPSWRVRPRGASVRTPKGEFMLERIGTEHSPARTDVGYRYYTWVP